MKTLSSLLLLASTTILLSFTFTSAIPDQEKWVAPVSSKELKNPFSDKASINQGKSIYNMRCMVCHGESGMGDGPAAKSLTPPAGDHSAAYVQDQTDGELFWKISEGRGPMVGWKLILTKEDRWNLVNYIRTLAK